MSCEHYYLTFSSCIPIHDVQDLSGIFAYISCHPKHTLSWKIHLKALSIAKRDLIIAVNKRGGLSRVEEGQLQQYIL